MSYKIYKTTPNTMYNVTSSSNVDIKPTGLEFISLDIGDYAEPGENFTITLSREDPLLKYNEQLYTIVDNFNKTNYNITPFFVNNLKREFNQVVYDCTKVYKGYLIVPSVYEGEVL